MPTKNQGQSQVHKERRGRSEEGQEAATITRERERISQNRIEWNKIGLVVCSPDSKYVASCHWSIAHYVSYISSISKLPKAGEQRTNKDTRRNCHTKVFQFKNCHILSQVDHHNPRGKNILYFTQESWLGLDEDWQVVHKKVARPSMEIEHLQFVTG